MHSQIEDRRIIRVRPLTTPAVLAEQYPASGSTLNLVDESRRTIEDILDSIDRRKIVVVGPCSIHDPEAALAYATALKAKVGQWDHLFVIMRVYFEKPRTIVGWKGLINDPDIDNSFNINKGLGLARKLLLDISEIGLPCGTEFLDTTFGQYYADLISWGAIGARTAESQIHRELASGLSMPVGIKNRTDGNLQVAVDGIQAAAHKHLFPSLTKEGAPAIFETSGNQYCHLILRGGDQAPNYDESSLKQAANLLNENKLSDSLIVDCSHGNSQKDHLNQIKVIDSLCDSIGAGLACIKGVMLESHLKTGRQNYDSKAPDNKPLQYGISITDACLSLEQTWPLLDKLNSAAAHK